MTNTRAGGSRVRTVFLGSGRFGVPSLRILAKSPLIELVGIVTAPPRPAGRRQALRASPIASAAHAMGIRTVLAPVRLRAPEAVATVLELAPELAVLADYGQIVPAALLGLRHAALNLHPSLLPRHRGASPIPATILAGDTETGVTLIRMDEGLDSGPIVAQRYLALEGSETAPLLEDALETLAATLLSESLGPWLAGEIGAVPQSPDGATLTRPLRREDGRLDPDRPAFELERRVRAYLPWPGTFVETALGRLIIHQASVGADVPGDHPGALVADATGLALATVAGRVRIERAQLAGREVTDAASLRRGAPGLVGQRVLLR